MTQEEAEAVEKAAVAYSEEELGEEEPKKPEEE